MGEEELHKYMEWLIDLSELWIVKDMEESVFDWENVNQQTEEAKNFKIILKRQKQMISFLSSYSFIINNFTKPPSELAMVHFYKLTIIATSTFRKLYEKYRPKFFESLTSIIMSISNFKSFMYWIWRFIKEALI